MLPDYLPVWVVVNNGFHHRLARSLVVNGHDLLRRSSLASRDNPLRVNWREDSARGAARPTCNQTEDSSLFCCNLWRHHLVEDFGRAVKFELGLHQIALKVRYGRDVQGHLKRRHLSGVTLSETFQREVELSNLRACKNRGLARSHRAFDCVRAAVYDVGPLSTARQISGVVVTANAEKFGGVLQPIG